MLRIVKGSQIMSKITVAKLTVKSLSLLEGIPRFLAQDYELYHTEEPVIEIKTQTNKKGLLLSIVQLNPIHSFK